MVTGGFRSVAVMNDALADSADLIGMARPFIVDPSFPSKLLQKAIDSAPAVERDFPPPEELPRIAGLNWFCHQLVLLAETGVADLSVPVTEGNERYLAKMQEATTLHLRARDK